MDLFLMVVSFLYAGLIVWIFGIRLSARIRGEVLREPQYFEKQSKLKMPPPSWWVIRVFLIALGYAAAIGLTLFVYQRVELGGYYKPTDLATLFSASMGAIFAAPSLLVK